MKRIILLLLAIIIVFMPIIGCANEKFPEGSVDRGNANPNYDPNAPKTLDNYDQNWPDMDEYEFVLTGNKYVAMPNTDILNDQRLELYASLQEKLNCKITLKNDVNAEQLLSAGLAGDVLGDFISMATRGVGPMMKKNYFTPLDDPKYVAAGFDVNDESRWLTLVNCSSNVYGRQWGVTPASQYLFPQFGTFIVYNTRLVREAGIDIEGIKEKVRKIGRAHV